MAVKLEYASIHREPLISSHLLSPSLSFPTWERSTMMSISRNWWKHKMGKRFTASKSSTGVQAYRGCGWLTTSKPTGEGSPGAVNQEGC